MSGQGRGRRGMREVRGLRGLCRLEDAVSIHFMLLSFPRPWFPRPDSYAPRPATRDPRPPAPGPRPFGFPGRCEPLAHPWSDIITILYRGAKF